MVKKKKGKKKTRLNFHRPRNYEVMFYDRLAGMAWGSK